MKKLRMFSLALMAMIALSGCFNELETEIGQLERRIKNLEERCALLNTNIESLRAVLSTLESYDFITRVEPVYAAGREAGYTIYFTHSAPITIYSGTNANTPILGVAKAEDGIYYWTVRYSESDDPVFITDNFGVKIPTAAVSPKFKIENGNWLVSYDNGDIWHMLGRATGDPGISFFESIEDAGDFVRFKLINGSTISIPYWESFEKLEKDCRQANENLAAYTALAAKIDTSLYATQVFPIMEGRDTVGFRLFLSDGSSYAFHSGTATNVPVIGASRDTANPSDTLLYWTITYSGEDHFEWIRNDKGEKISMDAASGKLVQLTLLRDSNDGKYYWAVAYGNEPASFLLHNGERVCANAQSETSQVSLILSVDIDRIMINLTGVTSYLIIPVQSSIAVYFPLPVRNGGIYMTTLDMLDFTFDIAGGNEKYSVLPVTFDGFYCTVTTTDYVTWTATVKSPSTFKKGMTSHLNLLISNGKGTMKTVVIKIEYPN